MKNSAYPINWSRRSTQLPRVHPAAYAILLYPFLVFSATEANAACVTTGHTTICNTNAPNPTSTPVGTPPYSPLPPEANRTVIVKSGATLATGDISAISLGDNARITVQSGATVSTDAVWHTGNYGTGENTIEFRNNGRLTVQQGAKVLAIGPELQGEAVNVQGTGNVINNSGLIQSSNAAAIWFENTTGRNTVFNNATGVIEATGNVIGNTGNGALNFTNRGQVVGDLLFAGGNDRLTLYTGSSISGNMDGGAGYDRIYLDGTGASQLSGTLSGFEQLVKNDAGTWTLNGAILGVERAYVHEGTLVLNGDNSGYTGSMTVDPAGTLQGPAQSLPPTVLDNGLVRFAQPTDGTYAGLLSGTGAVEKTGAGVLTLSGVNPYTGGTTVSAGTLAIGDAAHTNAALSGGGATTIASGATLGGYGSVTGAVNNSGTIAVADALGAFAGNGGGSFTINGNLTNAGLVSVGGAAVGNQLVVNGNYVGQNGTIALNTVLGSDGSPSDKLVVNGGTATGNTALAIHNVGGGGAQTIANGIQVVQTTNGGSTAATAFTLAGPVKAGAYSYNLARGNFADGSGDDWYLRNTLPAVPPPGSGNPGDPGNPGGSGPGTGTGTGTGPSVGAGIGGGTVPTYRPEAPVYAEVSSVVQQLGIQQVDNFHDRQGDQSLLTENGRLPASWGRAWGGSTVLSQSGALSPEFNGSTFGVQVGQDVYADTTASGHRNHYGFLAGFARATGDVEGFANGIQNFDAGHLSVNTYSVGGYWTHIGPGGWYTDTVLMGSSLTINPVSSDGIGASTHGRALTGSVEAGLPIPVSAAVTFEPQAQLIWQNVSINDLNDGVSGVSFKPGSSYVARVGGRMQFHLRGAAIDWMPYLRLNVLHYFGASNQITLGGTPLTTSADMTAGQIGAGVVAQISKSASAFGTVSYQTNLGGSHMRTVLGNAGVRWRW